MSLVEPMAICSPYDRHGDSVGRSRAMENSVLIHSISLIAPRGNTISIKACGEGSPLFLIHGFPLDHRMWLNQIESFGVRYQVIVPELRGFGGSSVDNDYSLAELADDIELVRTHLTNNRPIRFVGLSMGGYVAFEYWKRYGHHLEALVLANTKPSADDQTAQQGRMAMAEKALVEGGWAAVAPMLDKLIPAAAKGTNVADQMTEMMQSASPQSIAAAQRAMANRSDFTSQLSGIKARTLVVTGQLDPIAPPAATKAWSEQIPQSTYVEFAGAGHMTPLEVPELFNEAVLKFLG
jgi:3-oxoadipate enol-lactonase